MMANVDGQPGVAWWTRRGGSRSGVSATVTHPPPFRAVWTRARRAVKTQNTREKGASDRYSASLAQFKASGEVKQQFVLFCPFCLFGDMAGTSCLPGGRRLLYTGCPQKSSL